MIRRPPTTQPPTPEMAMALQAGVEFHILQQLEEIVQLLIWLLDQGIVLHRVVEIGAHRGGTAAVWSTVTKEQVISIDLPGGIGGGISWEAALDRNRKLKDRFPDVFIGILGDSHDADTLLRVQDVLTGPADLLFIDGDHSLESVTADYEMYKGLVRPGGVIAFHDIRDTPEVRNFGGQVKTFWESLPEPKTTFIDGDWGGIGVIRTPEATG